jgi:glycosyltransferase involved in cell wall biosynthesis
MTDKISGVGLCQHPPDMRRRPPVTLLLPNRNNERVLDLTLERLATHTTSYPSFELVVVDDGSTDGSVAILRRWRDHGQLPSMTLIEREHSGVVETLNAGLAAASGELIVQLDGDATVETPGWLERMVDFHETDQRVGVVTPLVTFEGGSIHAAGVNIVGEEGLHDRGTTPSEPVGRRTVHTVVDRMRPDTAGELVTRPAEVDSALGVNMLYAKALADEIGGYDPGFSPVWFDDLDLALSARKLGLKVFYVPGVHILHRMSLRGARTADSPLRAARRRVRSAVASVLPDRVTDAVVQIERKGTAHPPHELRRLEHHYAYWREKWGFDLLNPDMPEVRRRYGETEVCWAYDPGRRATGEGILAAWEAAAETSSA